MTHRPALGPALAGMAVLMLLASALTGWGWPLWATAAIASGALLVSSRM